MSHYYLYADQISRDILCNHQQKVIIIGGDFGNGNFGDVLQHLNALDIIKKSDKFVTISIFSAHAISNPDFPIWAKPHYGTDATIFIAEYPLILNENAPQLELIGEIRNLAAIYLYGGGFMNNMWGDDVLGVTEHFLKLAPHATYLVSGQQITPPYELRVLEHINTFNPKLFGVRDSLSQHILSKKGFLPSYSFDDATEALLNLTEKLPLQKGTGLLMHLNSSDYTKNNNLSSELQKIKNSSWDTKPLTLFQAFKDVRHEVYDSRETIKKLDIDFPFSDIRLIELTNLSYKETIDSSTLKSKIIGEIGYSCSYHVALWLQLSGIPCWLRSSNSFYDQKSKALQVTQNLDHFLNDPYLADHQLNLEQRAEWNSLFQSTLEKIPTINKITTIPMIQDGPEPWPFFFKGQPNLQEKLTTAENEITFLRQQINQLTEVGNIVHEQKVELEITKSQLQDTRQRLNAYINQLTEVGNIANEQQQSLQISQNRVLELETALHQVLTSKCWYITKPLRIIFYLIRCSITKVNQKLNLYEITKRIIKRFMPLRIKDKIRQKYKRYKK